MPDIRRRRVDILHVVDGSTSGLVLVFAITHAVCESVCKYKQIFSVPELFLGKQYQHDGNSLVYPGSATTRIRGIELPIHLALG